MELQKKVNKKLTCSVMEVVRVNEMMNIFAIIYYVLDWGKDKTPKQYELAPIANWT